MIFWYPMFCLMLSKLIVEKDQNMQYQTNKMDILKKLNNFSTWTGLLIKVTYQNTLVFYIFCISTFLADNKLHHVLSVYIWVNRWLFYCFDSFSVKKFQKMPHCHLTEKWSASNDWRVHKGNQIQRKDLLLSHHMIWCTLLLFVLYGNTHPFFLFNIWSQNVIFHVKSYITKHVFWGLSILKSQHPM